VFDPINSMEEFEEAVQDWMSENPEVAASGLAISLDSLADLLGRSQQARFLRTLATDTWKIHMALVGLDSLDFPEKEEGEHENSSNSNP